MNRYLKIFEEEKEKSYEDLVKDIDKLKSDIENKEEQEKKKQNIKLKATDAKLTGKSTIHYQVKGK